jgi:cyanophycinase
VERTTLAAGSLSAALAVLTSSEVTLPHDADIVVVTTAAAFTGATHAAVAVAGAFAELDARVEGVMVFDRASSAEPYFAQRIADADVVVLTDGSPLHARAVWRDTPVGAAIDGAALIVAIGSVATVLGDVMIDPRGGAPTVGLGYRSGVVVGFPAPSAQLARTRDLLGADETFVVVESEGAVLGVGGEWRIVRPGVVATRGALVVEL